MECEKAVFGGGEYELVEEFRNKEVPHSMWIQMSPEQRKKHIDKFHFSVGKQPCPTSVRPCLSKQLSTKWENAKIEHVHIQRLQDMWLKAEQLLSTPGFVIPAAGNPEMSQQVASLSNQGAKYVPPHFASAVRKVGTEVRCDCIVY